MFFYNNNILLLQLKYPLNSQQENEVEPFHSHDTAQATSSHCGGSAQYKTIRHTRVGILIVATTDLQLMQNRYMFRSFTVLQFSHQHCVQPVASDVEVVGYL